MRILHWDDIKDDHPIPAGAADEVIDIADKILKETTLKKLEEKERRGKKGR